jgi:hypothetical protein
MFNWGIGLLAFLNLWSKSVRIVLPMRYVLIAVLAAGGAYAQPVITPATLPVVVVGGTIN